MRVIKRRYWREWWRWQWWWCDDEVNGSYDGKDDENHTEGNDDGKSKSGCKLKRSFKDANTNSKMGRSDRLESPLISDEDGEITFIPNSDFQVVDLVNPVLSFRMKFSNIQLFREVVT